MHVEHVGDLREASRNLCRDYVLAVGIENDQSVILNKEQNDCVIGFCLP